MALFSPKRRKPKLYTQEEVDLILADAEDTAKRHMSNTGRSGVRHTRDVLQTLLGVAEGTADSWGRFGASLRLTEVAKLCRFYLKQTEEGD